MKNPIFSIVIPTYNRQKFLKIALESVLEQTFNDYELIIVDDGSTDSTREVIKNFSDQRIKYIYQRHQGVSEARNRGLKEARAEFICFLDSDDRFCKHKLETTYDYIKHHPQYKIFHTEEVWYRNGRLLPQKKHHRKPSGFVFPQALKLCCISISTVAIKPEVFVKVGIFDRKLPVCEDYDFWLRATSQYPVLLIPEYLTIKEGGHPDQQSKKYPAMDKFRIYALAKLLKNANLSQQNYSLAYKELINKCLIYKKGALKRKKLSEVRYCQTILDTLKKNVKKT